VTWAGWIAIAAAVSAAIAAPRPFQRVWRLVLVPIDAVARRRALAIATCAALSAVGSIIVAEAVRWPEPKEHDEFSYLLAADTFARGRLANRTHPMWRHFDTFHVMQEPTYASKYPPGQGLFLALGQAAFGQPLAGVWLSGALMAAALCWMLYGFLPPRWAFIGGLVAVGRFGVASYWTQSYWGGAVAALGGALVLGALPRLVAHASARVAVLGAAGIALLANSRPFEGIVAAVPVAAALVAWFVRAPGPERRRALARAALPALLVLVAATVWMAVYNQTVTGSAFRLPYRAYQDHHPFTPVFLWLPVEPAPRYEIDVIRQMSDALIEPYRAQHALSGFLSASGAKLAGFAEFFVGPQLWIAFLALPWILRRRGMKVALATVALTVVAILVETYYMHHYFAPVTGAIVLLIAMGLRTLGAWRPGRGRVGAALVLGLLIGVGFSMLGQARELRRSPPSEWRRSAVLRELTSDPAPDLVIVRYGPNHVMNYEWVYNRADVDSSPVVWAHDLGAARNRELLAWYPGRKVSLLEVGFHGPPILKPYSE
jgi:hypothetical protein